MHAASRIPRGATGMSGEQEGLPWGWQSSCVTDGPCKPLAPCAEWQEGTCCAQGLGGRNSERGKPQMAQQGSGCCPWGKQFPGSGHGQRSSLGLRLLPSTRRASLAPGGRAFAGTVGTTTVHPGGHLLHLARQSLLSAVVIWLLAWGWVRVRWPRWRSLLGPPSLAAGMLGTERPRAFCSSLAWSCFLPGLGRGNHVCIQDHRKMPLLLPPLKDCL